MQGKNFKRTDIDMDFTREVRVYAKALIKKINNIKAKRDLPVILPRFQYYQIGQRAYYEMLAIEFVKHVDEFNFREKCNLIESFALADIDSGNILKTVQKLC
jgi:DNA replication initiation complex subunit (GINS family)